MGATREVPPPENFSLNFQVKMLNAEFMHFCCEKLLVVLQKPGPGGDFIDPRG